MQKDIAYFDINIAQNYIRDTDSALYELENRGRKIYTETRRRAK